MCVSKDVRSVAHFNPTHHPAQPIKVTVLWLVSIFAYWLPIVNVVCRELNSNKRDIRGSVATLNGFVIALYRIVLHCFGGEVMKRRLHLCAAVCLWRC